LPGIHGTYALAHTPTSSLSLLGVDTPGATGGAYRRRAGFANVGWEIPYSASL
jgi:hypothetical protein